MTEQEKRDHVLTWVIARAWELMSEDERSEVESWCGYVEQHAPEVLEKWGSMMQ